MKLLVTVFTSLFFLNSWAKSELPTVDYVDLTRYSGQWYEIATIPQSFQKQCVKNTKADYSVEPQTGYLKVLNSCYTIDDTVSLSEGRARVKDTNTNAKLKVTFIKAFGKWIFAFAGDYWVTYLDSNYQYVIVGHPDRTYGWILSRTPEMSASTLKTLASHLQSNGYDLCKFNMSQQDNGNPAKVNLCQYLETLD